MYMNLMLIALVCASFLGTGSDFLKVSATFPSMFTLQIFTSPFNKFPEYGGNA
jgi:hypothetical protein